MRQKFSTLDIVKALGIPRERLRDWMNRGFIVPTQQAEGQGTKAIFSRIEVYGVALFQKLLKWGFGRQFAARFITAFIRADVPELIAYIVFRYESDAHGENIRHMTLPELKVDDPEASWRIELKYGTWDSEVAVDPIPPNENWEQLIIINFTKLKTDVDMSLSIFD